MKPKWSKTKTSRLVLVMLCALLVWPASMLDLFKRAEAAPDGETLIAMDSVWSYLDDGSDQKSAWRDEEYDDGAWKSGAAPLGYGGDALSLSTQIGYGSDASRKAITAYFRQQFDIEDASSVKQLTAKMIRDDGAVVYLNGNELYRTNLPAGPIAYNTPAVAAVGNERNEYEFAIDPWMLKDGVNVMTVEVHQNAPSSSDLFFSLELTGNSTPPAKDQGLFAEYYTNKGPSGEFAFDERKSVTVDPAVNFTDLNPILARMTGMEDTASARWTGQIVPPATGDYTFYMTGDNGFRLWVDDMNAPLIDYWVDEYDKEQTSRAIRLEAGRKYAFKIEFFEHFGGANLYLRWSGPGIDKQIVPAGALLLPASYIGPTGGKTRASGDIVDLRFSHELGALPDDLNNHLRVEASGKSIAVEKAELSSADASIVQLELGQNVAAGHTVKVRYDGESNLRANGGDVIGSFDFAIENASRQIDYSPVAIAMSLHGSAKTNRAFAWYTSYDYPDDAPENAEDSIVEIVPADGNFGTDAVLRFEGESQMLQNLKFTGSTTISFIGHKALVEGLTPGTSYKYRLGSDGNWSETGSFVTEAENEDEYEFLYLTDSQGGNSGDYQVWANTLGQAVNNYPDSRFLVMTGDMVDAGALESQWLDYFGKPQSTLLNLPVMAAVGNHEGPYNDNYYYHFNYPNDQIDDPLPPGSVYSYDYGDAHFMILNTMDMGWDARQRESFEQQIDWLRREVAGTDKKWKVVAFHKAIYSVGGHSNETEIYELRDMLYPVFDELGIDVVLQGHDHSFVRTHQMYGDKAVRDVEKDENGNPLNPKGTLYMINNAAGTKFYDVRTDINDYYSAVKEQPKKAIYSGIRMTKDSFTIESYRSGEAQPFDTYTIVRDDTKPAPVEYPSGGLDGNGKVSLSWSMPGEAEEREGIRGFRIYETSGKMGRNWSLYVPAEAGRANYSQAIEGAELDEHYEFAIRSVDERNNSDEVKTSVQGDRIASPSAPAADDGYNTFGWYNVPGFDTLAEYEYTLDGGATWRAVAANPQPVGDADYETGAVGVRVKAGAGREAGLALWSDKPFTVNSVHDVYSISGKLKRDDGISIEATIKRKADYDGPAYAVFQLMDGKTPILINAVPIKRDEVKLSQRFNVSGGNYTVRAFVFDSFDSESTAPVNLARAFEFKN